MDRAVSRLSCILLASALAAVPAVPAAGQLPDPEPKPLPCIPKLCPRPVTFEARVDGPASLEVAASPEGQAKRIDVLGWSWGKIADAGTVYSADPQEGGQVTSRDTSDPQEGGQIAGRKAGKGQHEWRAQMAEPPPSGTLTVRLARGAAVKGQHLPEVKLSAKGGRAYRLRDVEVAECSASGDKVDICLLTYRTVRD